MNWFGIMVMAILVLFLMSGRMVLALSVRGRHEAPPIDPAKVLVISQLTYNADPEFFRRQALLAGITLQVQRDTGGWSETRADGGYAHVCTRKDLAGQR